MSWRALQGLLNRVWWRRARVEGLDAGTSFRAEAAAQAGTLPDPPPQASSPGRRGAGGAQMQDDVEEIDRLVDLTFVALLRRKPDRDTLLAYREGFADGTTFHDLIDDVIGSDEYRSVKQRLRERGAASAYVSEATPGSVGGDDLPTTVALLTTRLIEKGWQPRVSAIAEADSGGDGDGPRMRSLRVTLSVLDRL